MGRRLESLVNMWKWNKICRFRALDQESWEIKKTERMRNADNETVS